MDNGERASVSVAFLRSPMALASSGRPFASGAPSVDALVADSVDKLDKSETILISYYKPVAVQVRYYD